MALETSKKPHCPRARVPSTDTCTITRIVSKPKIQGRTPDLPIFRIQMTAIGSRCNRYNTDHPKKIQKTARAWDALVMDGRDVALRRPVGDASILTGRARTPCAPRRAEDCPPYQFHDVHCRDNACGGQGTARPTVYKMYKDAGESEQHPVGPLSRLRAFSPELGNCRPAEWLAVNLPSR